MGNGRHRGFDHRCVFGYAKRHGKNVFIFAKRHKSEMRVDMPEKATASY